MKVLSVLLSLAAAEIYIVLTFTSIASFGVEGRHVDSSMSHPSLPHTLTKRSRKSKNATRVMIPLPQMKFKTPLEKTVEVKLFQELELTCAVFGFPPPQIRWLKNGVDFANMEPDSPYVESMAAQEEEDYIAMIKTWGRHVYKFNMGSTVSKLNIDCVSPSDLGEYTCVSESKFLRKENTTRVILTRDDSSNFEEFPVEVDNPSCVRDVSPKVPRIHSYNTNIMDLIGLDVIFYCRYFDGSAYAIKWYDPDEKELPEISHKYKITAEGDLIIRKLEWKDMGSYYCRIETSSGLRESRTFIYPLKPDNEDESLS